MRSWKRSPSRSENMRKVGSPKARSSSSKGQTKVCRKQALVHFRRRGVDNRRPRCEQRRNLFNQAPRERLEAAVQAMITSAAIAGLDLASGSKRSSIAPTPGSKSNAGPSAGSHQAHKRVRCCRWRSWCGCVGTCRRRDRSKEAEKVELRRPVHRRTRCQNTLPSSCSTGDCWCWWTSWQQVRSGARPLVCGWTKCSSKECSKRARHRGLSTDALGCEARAEVNGDLRRNVAVPQLKRRGMRVSDHTLFSGPKREVTMLQRRKENRCEMRAFQADHTNEQSTH